MHLLTFFLPYSAHESLPICKPEEIKISSGDSLTLKVDESETLAVGKQSSPVVAEALFQNLNTQKKKRDSIAATESWMQEQSQHLGNLEERIFNLKDRWSAWLEKLHGGDSSEV